MKVSFDISGSPITMKLVDGKVVIEGNEGVTVEEPITSTYENHYDRIDFSQYTKGTVFIPMNSDSVTAVYCVISQGFGWECTCPASVKCKHIVRVEDIIVNHFNNLALNLNGCLPYQLDHGWDLRKSLETAFNQVHINV